MHRHNSIRYVEFLDKFATVSDSNGTPGEEGRDEGEGRLRANGAEGGKGEKQKTNRLLSPCPPTDLLNVEKLEQALRDKVGPKCFIDPKYE